MNRDPYRYFRIEARELLEQLGAGFVALENAATDPDRVSRLLRLAHTLKGAARVVRQSAIAEHAHAIEDALAPHRDGTDAVPRETVDRLLAMLDAIGACLAALGVPAEAPAEPAAAAAVQPLEVDDDLRALRADAGELDALLDDVAAVHAELTQLRTALQPLQGARALLDQFDLLLADAGAARDATVRVRGVADDLRGSALRAERRLADGVERCDRALAQLRGSAESLRLTQARAIFGALERTARDVARMHGKQVRFEASGGHVRLDPDLLVAVQAALVQAVRNAVAHGIGTPAQRRNEGRAEHGTVRIGIAQRGGRLVFDCSDDGRGIDVDAVRRIALARGLSHDPAPSDDAVLDLLLRGGLSTAHAVDETAGRGVGLDVVRAAATKLGGDVSLSTSSAGTRVRIDLPLRVAALDVLAVDADQGRILLPLSAVRGSLRFDPARLRRTQDGETYWCDDRELPYGALQRLLAESRRQPSPSPPTAVVLVDGASGAVALGVERLHGVGRAVVRALPDLTPPAPLLAGTAISADGEPQPVLDPDALAALLAAAGAPPAAVARTQPHVLVIDDSLTTRMLEQSILESAGYRVDVAVSAEDALQAASLRRYDLFLCDVEMPGMDGFAFVERTRGDPQLRDVPTILVTSRHAPEDRLRGQRAGAAGYIVKSEFDQGELLARIARLLGTDA